MTELIKASMRIRGGVPPPVPRGRAPAADKPLGESFRFAEWADEYKLLELYRRIVVRGDDASRSLKLIRDAIGLYGYPMVQSAVHAYASEASGSEPRFRKRPFTFFQPDIVSQFIQANIETGAPSSPVDELKSAIAAALAVSAKARRGDETP